MSQGPVWKKSNTTTKMKMGESIKQVDTLERFQTPNHWNNSIHSEAFTEQKSLREHGPGQHPNLDLSILSRQNQSVTSGVSTHGVPQKVQPTSHFGRKNKQQEGEQPKLATDKLSVLRGLLSSIESVQLNKKQLDGGSMATVVLDNSERPNNNNNPSSLVSGRSGQVHSTVSVPQTLQEKEMILKLVKLRTQKTQELKESKYFLLKSRLQQLNNSLVVLRDEEKKLGSHADKQIHGLGQSTIQEFGEESPVQSPEESERQMLELVAIVRKTSKSIEQLEEQLRLTTCKHALLQVQIGILEEGFLSPNLSGTKSNHTREVTDIKSDALTMIKSMIEDEKLDEASEALQVQFKNTIVKTTESILGELVQELTRNHQQHEAAYSFLDSTYDKLELALQTERTQTSTKKLPVLLHQRSRSDHVAEYNRKKDRRSTQLQRFLPVSGHINIVFQEMKSKNFQMDLSTILFNQLYANHVKYGKTLKMLDRRPGIQAINSVPVSPQKVSKTEGEMKDSNINSVQPEFVIKKALPSLYKRNRSITNSANSSSVETKGKENAVQVLFVPSNLPTIKQPNQKYWSAGNLKITNRRPYSRDAEPRSNSQLDKVPDVSEINTESRSEFSRSGQGVAVQFTNEKFHNKAWDREPRRLVEGDTRPKTGQKVDGLIETSSKGMNSRQSSKYYLNNPAALKRTRSISEKYKVLPAVPGSLPNSGEVTPLAQKPVVDQKKPSKSNWEAQNNPTTEQSTTGKQNQPVVPTEPEVVVVPIKAENKLAEHVQPQVSIPIPLPNAKTDKQPKTSPFRLSITPTAHPKTETKGPVQVAPSQLSAKNVEGHPLEGPRKTFSEKKISSTQGSQLVQKQGIVDSRIKGFIEKPQPEKTPEKTEELATRKPTEQTFPRELGPDPVTEKPQQILHVEPVNPDPDRMSYKTGNDNDDLASYLQDLDSDKDSVQAWDNGESPLQNPSKISRFHPSNSPRKSDTKKKTADGIYAVRDSIAESQQRAPDHFNPESPPSTPESPPQPLASRQLARPVRLGLNPRTTVSLKDRPRQLMRYVFRKVVRMISEVSRLIEQQQKAFGPSISLTFKGPDGGAMTPGPATSPQESRKFDFSKQQSNLPLSQPMNFSSKPSTKLEFDIYQPKEFNVNPAFSQRSNTGREQGFLLAVQQLTKTSFVLGNSPNPDGKDFSNSQAKNEFARSRHVMSSTNVLPEGQQLVLNKVPSNGGNRSLTSSSAMKELSYDEYAAESYGAEPEDKHNNSLIISNRKMYERYYIGYFDFKQRTVRRHMLTFDHEDIFQSQRVTSVARIVAVTFMGSIVSLQISYHLEDGGIFEAPLIGMDVQKFFSRAKVTKEVIEIPRDVAVMSVYSSFNRNKIQNLKLTTSRNEVLGFGEEKFEDEGQNFGQDIRNKKKFLFMKGGFVKRSGRVDLAYMELFIEE